MHAAITKLAVNWLVVAPFTVHPIHIPHRSEVQELPSIDDQSSYSVIGNYNTIALASTFLQKFLRAIYADKERLAFIDLSDKPGRPITFMDFSRMNDSCPL
jgi:hypothetical protein